MDGRENILDLLPRSWFIGVRDVVCRMPAFCHPSFIHQRFRRQVTIGRRIGRVGPGGLIVGGPSPKQSRQFPRDVVVVSENRVNARDSRRFGAIARRPATGHNHPRSWRLRCRIGWMFRLNCPGLDRFAPERGCAASRCSGRGRMARVQHRQTRRPANELAALAGGLARDAAGVNHPHVALRVHLNEAGVAKRGGDLLALVMVDATAERVNGKRSHETTRAARRGSEDRENRTADGGKNDYARAPSSKRHQAPAITRTSISIERFTV